MYKICRFQDILLQAQVYIFSLCIFIHVSTYFATYFAYLYVVFLAGPDAFSAKFRTVIFAAEYAYFNTVDCMFLLGKRCFSLQFAFRKFRSLRKRYA